MSTDGTFNAKCRITLKTVNSIYAAIRWAIEHNRGFTIFTNHLALGWSIDLDILPDESVDELSEGFNK